MITPFYWHFEDPDIGLTRSLLFPFFYNSSSPRGYETMLFPFFLHTKRAGLSESVWVTPFFEHSHDLSGWSTNLYPFLYLGRSEESTHTVVAPIFWDFASPKSRVTIAFPLYWRFADTADNSVLQVAGNTLYMQKKAVGGTDWQFHVLPFFSYGEDPNGYFWNVLFGLAGYQRSGSYAQVKAFWIPIQVAGPSQPQSQTAKVTF